MKMKLFLILLILSLIVFVVGCTKQDPIDSGGKELLSNSDTDFTDEPADSDLDDSDSHETSLTPEPKVIGDIEFEILSLFDLPADLQTAFDFIKEHRGFGIMKEAGEDIIVFVGAGEKMTGGYAINVISIEKTNDEIILIMKETSPKPGDMVTEAITYPAELIKLTTDIRKITVKNTEGEIFENINAEKS